MNKNLADYLEWDVKSWSKAISFWEKNIDNNLETKECIELGGRRGGLSLWLAEKGAKVICSDLDNPKEEAEKFHKKFKFKGQINYEAIDASNMPYENKFDIVILKSIMGGIARKGKDSLKPKVVNEIYKSLKPGGKLLFAENLEASKIHRFFRKRFIRWGDEWNYIKYSEINQLFSPFNSIYYSTNGFLSVFGRNEWQRNFLAYLDNLFFNRIVAPSKKYIVYGIATK